MPSLLTETDPSDPSDQAWMAKAAEEFNKRKSLGDAIDKQVRPALCLLDTPRGRCTLYHFAPDWFVSTTHGIDGPEALRRSLQIDPEFNQCRLFDVKDSFHRDFEKDGPDLMLCHQAVNIEDPPRSLSPFSFNQNQTFPSELYVMLDLMEGEGDPDRQIKFVDRVEEDGNILYRYDQDKKPQPGCSGTPIIKAQLIRCGQKLKWHFSVEGLLSGIDNDMIHVVDILPDLEQVRHILIAQEQHQRDQEMKWACELMRIPFDKDPNLPDVSELRRDYQSGYSEDCPVRVLPWDPTKITYLWYKKLIQLNQSLLLSSNWKQKGLDVRSKMKSAGFDKKLALDVLKLDFFAFLEKIKGKFWKFPSDCSESTIDVSGQKYVRMDIQGVNPKMIMIEDMISDHKNAPLLDAKGKTLSSRFAMVKILDPPAGINGNLLSKLLYESYKHGKTAVVVFEQASCSDNKSKNKKSKKKKSNNHVGKDPHYNPSTEFLVKVVNGKIFIDADDCASNKTGRRRPKNGR